MLRRQNRQPVRFNCVRHHRLSEIGCAEVLQVRIGERLEPYCTQHALLMQIPGVDWLVAAVLIAEIGVDMSVFLSVYHLAAWAGVCPGQS